MKTKYALRGGPLHGQTFETEAAMHVTVAIPVPSAGLYDTRHMGPIAHRSVVRRSPHAVYVQVREFDGDGKRLPILQFLRMED